MRRRPGVDLLTILAMLLVAPLPMAAQTMFIWPDTTVDLSRYETAEECLVATLRVANGYARRARQVAWLDTLPWSASEARTRLAAPATETARRCAAPFNPGSTPLNELKPLLQLFLLADRDADAAALVDRRLASLPPSASLSRVMVVDSVIKIYKQAKPVRLAAMVDLMRKLDPPSGVDAAGLALDVVGDVIDAARSVGDTTLMQSVATRGLALLDSMPERDRQALHERYGAILDFGIYTAMETRAGPREFLDSLRRSTASFVAAKRTLWAEATGERPDALAFPIGEHAPTLAGDFWFARRNDESIPRRGRISLIVFDTGECAGGPRWAVCAPRLAVLRRFAARFPELDIITVASTRGGFWYASPPAPAEEADLIQQQLAAYGVPGTISVTTSPFLRLPDPDLRRITRDIANVSNYTFGKSWNVSDLMTFLVDEDGVIVHAANISRESEEDIAKLIEVLLTRHHTGA